MAFDTVQVSKVRIFSKSSGDKNPFEVMGRRSVRWLLQDLGSVAIGPGTPGFTPEIAVADHKRRRLVLQQTDGGVRCIDHRDLPTITGGNALEGCGVLRILRDRCELHGLRRQPYFSAVPGDRLTRIFPGVNVPRQVKHRSGGSESKWDLRNVSEWLADICAGTYKHDRKGKRERTHIQESGDIRRNTAVEEQRARQIARFRGKIWYQFNAARGVFQPEGIQHDRVCLRLSSFAAVLSTWEPFANGYLQNSSELPQAPYLNGSRVALPSL